MSTVAAVRARASGGTSNEEVLYHLVKRLILERSSGVGIVADVGCGQGRLFHHLAPHLEWYLGVDLVRYEDFPDDPRIAFHQLDLDMLDVEYLGMPRERADVVCSLETIEHVENPRALMRALVQLARPGGIILVTTPNQLSILSKLCLMLKNEFVHFQERPGLYPSHLSALLEIDLIRMARENGLVDVEIAYTGRGRIPGTSRHWPRWCCAERGWRGRALSDNVILFGRKPERDVPRETAP